MSMWNVCLPFSSNCLPLSGWIKYCLCVLLWALLGVDLSVSNTLHIYLARRVPICLATCHYMSSAFRPHDGVHPFFLGVHLLFVCLSRWLPNCLSTTFGVHSSVRLPVSVAATLSIYLSSCAPQYLYIFTCVPLYVAHRVRTLLSVYQSTCDSVNLSQNAPHCLPVLMCMRLFVWLSVYLAMWSEYMLNAVCLICIMTISKTPWNIVSNTYMIITNYI